jgi:hypothetical protein
MADKQKKTVSKKAAAKEPSSTDKMKEALARVQAAKGGGPGGGALDGKRSNASALKGSQVKAAQLTRRTQGKGG